MSVFRRNKGASKSHPITPKRGLFNTDVESPRLAEEVHAESISDAEASAKTLRSDFDKAKTRAKKERIWHAAHEEANRLEVISTNPRVSPEVRDNLKKRYEVFLALDHNLHSQLWPAGGMT